MNILNYLVRFIIKIFSIFPIKKNKILIINFYGKGYSENPKYMCDELIKDNKYKIYWAVNNMKDEFPSGIKRVKYNSLSYFYHISTSKIWVSNVRLPYYFTKRKKQVYIQTWHGGLGFKKIEYDVINKLSNNYIKCMENDNKMINYFVSNSKWFEGLIHNTFKSSAKVLKYGFPKEDCLFLEKDKKSVFKKYNIENKKIVLYAPTFRNSYDNNPYNIDFNKLLDSLKEVTSEEWVVAVKLHPNVKDYKNIIQFEDGKVIDVNDFQDTQKLVVNCDLLISDYSSVLFDGLVANIPTLIYASDIDDYLEERGFYFDLKDLPFSISTDTEELCSLLKDNYLENYEKEYKKFLKEVGYYSKGDSSKKIASFIKDLM